MGFRSGLHVSHAHPEQLRLRALLQVGPSGNSVITGTMEEDVVVMKFDSMGTLLGAVQRAVPKEFSTADIHGTAAAFQARSGE